MNVAGLAVSAAVSLASLPLLSRVYSPPQYGEFALIFAIASVVSVAATARYELAIVVPGADKEGLAVAGVAFGAAGASLAIALTIFAAAAAFFGTSILWIFAAAIVFEVACVQITSNLAIRFEHFTALAIARSLGAITQVATAIALGMQGMGTQGLLIAFLTGYAVTVAIVVVSIVKQVREHWPEARLIAAAGRRFKNYPLLNLPASLADSFASQLPLLWFGWFYSPHAAGQLAMFLRLWSGTSIITKGLGEVFRSQASREMHKNGFFRSSFNKAAVPVSLFATGALLLLVFSPSELFAAFLGQSWSGVGIYGAILAPAVCLQLVANTTSYSFLIADRLAQLTALQFALLIVQGGALLLAHAIFGTDHAALIGWSVSGVVLYAIYIALSYRTALAPAT